MKAKDPPLANVHMDTILHVTSGVSPRHPSEEPCQHSDTEHVASASIRKSFEELFYIQWFSTSFSRLNVPSSMGKRVFNLTSNQGKTHLNNNEI